MLPGLVIPAKAGIQRFVNYRIIDSGFHQYDALRAFWDRLIVLSLSEITVLQNPGARQCIGFSA